VHSCFSVEKSSPPWPTISSSFSPLASPQGPLIHDLSGFPTFLDSLAPKGSLTFTVAAPHRPPRSPPQRRFFSHCTSLQPSFSLSRPPAPFPTTSFSSLACQF
jgi:hypothetical protein